MAAVVNARDVLLQAAGTRLLSLPLAGTLDFANVTGGTKPANNADVTVTAVNGGVVVTGGGITFNAGGSIKGGQTDYNTGVGFFAGYSGGAHRFSFGNPAGQRITWDGATLTLAGSLDFANVTGASKPADNADVTLSAVNGGLAVTGGGITLTGGGAIKGGQTAYATGTGFFLGYSGATYKFSIGSSTKFFRWDGSNISMAGDITGDSNIVISGTAQFDGNLSNGFVIASVIANYSAGCSTGVYAKAGPGGGTALLGVGGTGWGVVGSTTSATYSGGYFSSNASGNALFVENTGTGKSITAAGRVVITNSANTTASLDVTASGTSSAAGSFTNSNSSKAISLAAPSYAAYTNTGQGDWYCAQNVYGNGAILTFTGAHLALAPIAEYVLGDILVDDEILVRTDVNNALGTVLLSNTPTQRGVLGVIGAVRSLASDTFEEELPYALWWELHDTHLLLNVNGVGEGLINVCGEGGGIEKGDLIVTSSITGKGMRQADDLIRSYTVAKAREAVTFSDPGEVKQIACIYLAG